MQRHLLSAESALMRPNCTHSTSSVAGLVFTTPSLPGGGGLAPNGHKSCHLNTLGWLHQESLKVDGRGEGGGEVGGTFDGLQCSCPILLSSKEKPCLMFASSRRAAASKTCAPTTAKFKLRVLKIIRLWITSHRVYGIAYHDFKTVGQLAMQLTWRRQEKYLTYHLEGDGFPVLYSTHNKNHERLGG